MQRRIFLTSLGLALAAAAALAVALVPAALRAQQKCDVATGGKVVTFAQGTPSEAQYMGGGVSFTCPDGRVIKADSVVVLANGDQRLLIGHAYYSDKEKTLTADRITYLGAQHHMLAQLGATNPIVTLNDKVNGSVITGQYMDYYPAQSGQESRTTIYGGRPHAVLHGKNQPRATPRDSAAPQPSAAQPPAAPQPADTAATVVDADRMEITGQKTFHALGNVVLNRADMKATSADAVYDPDAEHLRLSGNANVTGKDFTLTAGTVDGTLVGNQFKDVTATFRAVLQSKDLRVNSPAMVVSFDQGQVQRLVALSAERARRTATDGKSLAEAFAKDFHLIADSIDAKAPNQKIDQVVAVGHAYGERQNDSIKVKMPEIASKDWLRGDTITGFFTDAPPKATPEKNGRATAGKNGKGNTAAPSKPAGKPVGSSGAGAAPADSVERVLERVVAVGGGGDPASSMYRITDSKKPEATPAISYLLAKKIEVAFRDGQVREVTADGEIRGIHLQPEEPKEKPKDNKAAPAKKVAVRSTAGSRQR